MSADSRKLRRPLHFPLSPAIFVSIQELRYQVSRPSRVEILAKGPHDPNEVRNDNQESAAHGAIHRLHDATVPGRSAADWQEHASKVVTGIVENQRFQEEEEIDAQTGDHVGQEQLDQLRQLVLQTPSSKQDNRNPQKAPTDSAHLYSGRDVGEQGRQAQHHVRDGHGTAEDIEDECGEQQKLYPETDVKAAKKCAGNRQLHRVGPKKISFSG
mmetsp:Transcript_59149/g.157409  ORF Transcript_59149/g.157409 Transcript_59149/m.157409 type:complete len:213 (-) Transcript_59149:34-672(-)